MPSLKPFVSALALPKPTRRRLQSWNLVIAAS
jgi:hypothetical protein